jgi:hypothetical protein
MLETLHQAEVSLNALEKRRSRQNQHQAWEIPLASSSRYVFSSAFAFRHRFPAQRLLSSAMV